MMKWTLFVLDLDGTYNMESEDSVGVQPFVYLIPIDRQSDVEACARTAQNDFFTINDSNLYIGDLFEEHCQKMDIELKPVGSIDLTFGERQNDYLANCIPRVVV